MFAMMCLFKHHVNALQLWNEYKHSMIGNFLISNEETATKYSALNLLSAIFREKGALGLPEQTGDPPSENSQINPPNVK